MWFYKLETKPSLLAGASEEKILRLRLGALGIWLGATIFLTILAITTYKLGWEAGAKEVLTITLAVVGSGGLGVILGERSGIKGGTKKKRPRTNRRS